VGERGVIFDVDGTLVDSNDAHAAAWQDVLREYDLPRDLASVRRLIAMGGDADLAGARAIYDDPADLLARYTPRAFAGAP
jgi:beta-phosphoglucomutase-like phosphatase (HAD superfamily)